MNYVNSGLHSSIFLKYKIAVWGKKIEQFYILFYKETSWFCGLVVRNLSLSPGSLTLPHTLVIQPSYITLHNQLLDYVNLG